MKFKDDEKVEKVLIHAVFRINVSDERKILFQKETESNEAVLKNSRQYCRTVGREIHRNVLKTCRCFLR